MKFAIFFAAILTICPLSSQLHRFETPVRVCQVTPDPLWTMVIQEGVAFLNEAVPMTIEEDDCDIQILLVRTFSFLPECYVDEIEPLGCTLIRFDDGRHADIYINRDTVFRMPVFYHEMLHALGITWHSSDQSDILYPHVHYRVVQPSEREMIVLTWLYKLPVINKEQ